MVCLEGLADHLMCKGASWLILKTRRVSLLDFKLPNASVFGEINCRQRCLEASYSPLSSLSLPHIGSTAWRIHTPLYKHTVTSVIHWLLLWKMYTVRYASAQKSIVNCAFLFSKKSMLTYTSPTEAFDGWMHNANIGLKCNIDRVLQVTAQKTWQNNIGHAAV